MMLTLCFCSSAWAGIETTATLPQGVYSPEFSFGLITGLGEKFDSSSSLVNVTDQYHLNLSGQNIAKYFPPAARLIPVLNTMSPSLGNNISVGSIDFQANPTIDYFVLNPAYGIKKNLAVGFGFPIIHFRNEMQIVASGTSNIQSIKAYTGTGSSEVNAGLALAASYANNLPAAVQSVLAARGYKPIGLVDFTTIGDTQLYARYRYFESDRFRLSIRPYFLLPTGRNDDPDDLGDLATGGYSGIGAYSTNELYIGPRWIFSGIVQYEAHLPDRVDKRVPTDATDILPSIEQKENVARQPGNLFDVVLGNKYFLFPWMSIGGFYDMTFKDPDWFSGGKNINYGILSQDTGYSAQKLGGFIEFSTIQSYIEKSFAVPFTIGYTFSNIVAGTNTPHSLTHLFNLRMFF